MEVFDAGGHSVGYVESPSNGYFFLTRESLLPLVTERIVVDVSASVVSVDARGVHLRHDRPELLARQARPPGAQSSRQVSPGEDTSTIRRGDEDRRPLDRGEASKTPGQGRTPT